MTQTDVRQIALSLPGAEEGELRFGFYVTVRDKHKGFVWAWNERVHPKQPKVPNTGVIAARTTNVAERDMIIASDPRVCFTEPHYNGFPAVLVRLREISRESLEVVVTEAWRCLAPREFTDLVF